jgi:hypothetical protein
VGKAQVFSRRGRRVGVINTDFGEIYPTMPDGHVIQAGDTVVVLRSPWVSQYQVVRVARTDPGDCIVEVGPPTQSAASAARFIADAPDPLSARVHHKGLDHRTMLSLMEFAEGQIGRPMELDLEALPDYADLLDLVVSQLAEHGVDDPVLLLSQHGFPLE